MFTRKNSVAIAVAFFALLVIVFGSARQSASGKLPEQLSAVAQRTVFVRSVPPNQTISVLLLLRSAHEDQIRPAIALQSDRRSWAYHRWITPDQYGQYFGANPKDLSATVDTLRKSGYRISYVARGRRFVIASAPASAIEATFAVPLDYRTDGRTVYRTNRYVPRIPSSLPGVFAVVGLDTSARVHTHLAQSAYPRGGPTPNATASPGFFAFGPQDLYAYYDFGSLAGASDDGTGYGIAIQLVRQPLGSDVTNFSSFFNIKNTTLTERFLNGMCTQPCPVPTPTNFADDKESAMDAQWAHAAAPGASIYTISVGDDMQASQLVGFAYIADVLASTVQFVGTSYGVCETLSDPQILPAEQAMVDQGNLEGQTWSAAAGDTGANDCDDAGLGTKKSTVDFPASLPNVLSGGGTTTTPMPVLGNITGYSTESTWNEVCTNGQPSGATGGGFSRIFPKPTWQTGKTPSDGNRDVPDVAAYADVFQPGSNCSTKPAAGYWVMFRGFWQQQGGTSIVPHIWNGILADIAQKDGHPFGNVLPALYSIESSAAFHQILTGNNTFNGVTGFNAGAGYNQTTGLGSPDAAQLAALLTATAPPSPAPTIFPFPNPSPTSTPASAPTARAFVLDKGTFTNDGHVDVLDATVGSTNGTLLNSVPGFIYPLDVAIDAPGALAYVVESGGQIDMLNTQTYALTTNAVSDPAKHPTSLAVQSNFLYVADEVARKVYVLPVPSSTATPPPAIAVGHLPSAVVANPNLTYAYVANAADNSVSIINTSSQTVVQTIKVGKDPVAMSVLPGGGQLLVANAGAGSVSLLNVATIPATVAATIKVGGEPAGISVAPDSLRAYVLNLVDPSVPSAGGVIEVILLSKRPRIVECCLGPFPYLSNLAVEPTGRYLWFVQEGAVQVSVLDTFTNNILTTTTLPGNLQHEVGNFVHAIP